MDPQTKAEVDRLVITDLKRQSKQWSAFRRPDDEEPADIALRVLFYASEVEALLKFQTLCESMAVDQAWSVAHGEG